MTVQEIEKRKKELGYTNKQLSELSSVPFSTVNKVLGGFIKAPRRDTLEKLSLALEHSLNRSYIVDFDAQLFCDNYFDEIISKAKLDSISYASCLGQSLKQISLRNTSFDEILKDIRKYRQSFDDIRPSGDIIGARFKSDQSIMAKYKKTLEKGLGFKQCFNDVVGIRIRMKEYPNTYPDYYRVVDLRKGKSTDDGYRAVHLYYQKDAYSYPIEIQIWAGDDYTYNMLSHAYVYKYKSDEVGRRMREYYDQGIIDTEEMFLKILERVNVNEK